MNIETVKEFKKILNISEEQVVQVVNYFKLPAEELLHEAKEGNVEVFDSYEDFFWWMHEDKSKDELIKHIWDEDNAVSEDQVITLDNDKTIFLYE